MHRIKLWLSGLLIGLFATAIYAVQPHHSHIYHSPIGYWKTIDDITGKPKSIVHIWKADNEMLMGKVIKIFPKKGDHINKLCTSCEGEKHNKPIIGMVILSGLRTQDAHWTKGMILDPENGKTYSCSMRLGDKGKRLNVYGYSGLHLLGRHQTWERVDLMSGK